MCNIGIENPISRGMPILELHVCTYIRANVTMKNKTTIYLYKNTRYPGQRRQASDNAANNKFKSISIDKLLFIAFKLQPEYRSMYSQL